MRYNGGTVIAMKGKNCVAIGSDKVFGVRGQMVDKEFEKVFRLGPKLFVGLSGLATDIQTVHDSLRFQKSLYCLKEEREMKASTMSSLLSNMLYSRRFGPYFVEPIIAGLDGPDNAPFISGMDLLGAECFPDDFVVAGCADEFMFGVCESLFKPDLEPEDLFEVVSQCLLSGVNRDAQSGWGAVVYILTPTEIIRKDLKGRMD
eukprot:CAMPEP_0177652640 /NCGR_PEP_ID=MMETSP0447-20121125/13248_1 /TAXON_ID=0 /ORGANISM="Stygamoeba regulata, Strain BSH-02190019" /LENGTH=202 /DNA_ID=CAMNT_0019155919 /DNA_START=152 /DNA_END=760 /DNA_ORIENTATION=-